MFGFPLPPIFLGGPLEPTLVPGDLGFYRDRLQAFLLVRTRVRGFVDNLPTPFAAGRKFFPLKYFDMTAIDRFGPFPPLFFPPNWIIWLTRTPRIWPVSEVFPIGFAGIVLDFCEDVAGWNEGFFLPR